MHLVIVLGRIELNQLLQLLPKLILGSNSTRPGNERGRLELSVVANEGSK